MVRLAVGLAAAALGLAGLALDGTQSDSRSESKPVARSSRTEPRAKPPTPIGHPTFVTPHANPIVVTGGRVFVVNTPDDTVDVIDANTRSLVARVHVGISPVGLAVRPDGKEVWVANHTSDSVSVIDTDRSSPTALQVVATIQSLDPATKATRFDEPVGIAFASNAKAYVSLSSENKVAVIDVASRRMTKTLAITAQDPRAIVVRGDRLYVLPFESNNKTQLSGGTGPIDGKLTTFDAKKHVLDNNNVLSVGAVVDIVKHPRVPDRDLYIFDTKTDQPVEVVDTLGTLLYGLAVDSKGRVFIAQTDARNDVNGRAGTKKHGLAELENRAFLNRITRVEPTAAPGRVGFFDLEPLPPVHPRKGEALATPFAIQISDDDKTLVVTAAGSDKLFTVDAGDGKVIGRVKLGAVPEGVALESAEGDRPLRAWVLNAVENSVSLVNLADPAHPVVEATLPLHDPTPPEIKRGRIAFSTANASTTGTFSCASCHPDGHTDQLLWVLKTPIVTGGDQIQPRSTMPARGLRDTAPFHWDGIPGDPYGGINSASVHRSVPANSKGDDALSSPRHLVDGGLGSTMMMVGDTSLNDEGKPGALSKAERDAMAAFLLSVPYPPAQRRAYNNVLSSEARKGFKLFHVDGDNDPSKRRPNVCGDCHRMPFLVSTNTPGTGMDAPTWRGAYDRWLILPQGRLNLIDFDFYRNITRSGTPERELWKFSWGGRRRFDPVWDMVLEGSTGFSGAFARQFTLARDVVADGGKPSAATNDLWDALEQAASEGAVVLQGEGALLQEGKASALALEFVGDDGRGTYVERSGDRRRYSRDDLIKRAADGELVVTFTARMGTKVDLDHPQPALWTSGPIHAQRGRQQFPILHRDQTSMKLSGRHIDPDASLFVDGRGVDGAVSISQESLEITFKSLPEMGLHFLQVQNRDGLFSNDFLFHVAENSEAAAELKRQLDRPHTETTTPLARAVARGNVDEVKKLLAQGAPMNTRQTDGGATPLSEAVVYGRLDVLQLLLNQGASVSATNEDGNTALHVAAFFCRTEMIRLLLEKGSSTQTKNKRGQTPADIVSTPWSKPLADFYEGINRTLGLRLDLATIEKQRPEVARMLGKP